MAAKAGRLEARFTLTTNQTVTYTGDVSGPTVITWVAGTYYLVDIVTTWNAAVAASLAISDGEGVHSSITGKATITRLVADATFTVTFTSTQIRDILGFTGNIASTAGPATGSNHCKGLWLPGQLAKFSMYGDSATGSLVTDFTSTVGPTGVVHAVYSQSFREHRGVRWEGVAAQRAMAHHESVTGESFESFFRDAALGRVSTYLPVNAYVRLYWDADTDGTYAVGRLLWPSTFDIQTLVSGWVGRYNVELPTLVVES